MSFDTKELKILEDKYLEAKDKYYNSDTPIMSDSEFDSLERKLKSLNSDVISKIGYETLDSKKIKHITPMLSLSKINSKDDSDPPVDEILKFIRKYSDLISNDYKYGITPKYDGSAVNLIYSDSKLKYAITRGDGEKGSDITEKLKLIVPNYINIDLSGELEIRGEVVISEDIFNEKYSDEFRNPRNFVSGVLNSDELDYDKIFNLTFIPFDIKGDYDKNIDNSFFRNIGFNDTASEKYYTYEQLNNKDNLKSIYDIFLNDRNTNEYWIDGFVIKYHNHYRDEIGENNHHPYWAKAIKFEAKESVTKIIDIEWKLGKTGSYTPIGILEPVELLGTTVSRVSLHNLNYILTNKTMIGAQISLVKSGDIIPMVKNVIIPSDNEFIIPEYMDNNKVEYDGVNLILSDMNNDSLSKVKFIKAIEMLNIDYLGTETIKKLWDLGITNQFDIFNLDIINDKNLSDMGLFESNSSSMNRLINSIKSYNKIEVKTIIKMMGINNLGNSLSTQISNKLYNIPYSYYGLNKSITDLFEKDEYIQKLNDIISYLEDCGMRIIYPIRESDKKTVEFTGSPKVAGFKVKADFMNFIESYGYKKSNLTSSTDFLICESYDTTTTKTKKANKLGVKIISYIDFVKMLTENENVINF